MTLTIGSFFEAGQKRLRLKVEAGREHFDREIPEPSMNRPGLALSGFFQYFASRRVQVFGLAEFAYLKSLSARDQAARLNQVMAAHIPGVILARNRHGPAPLLAAARTHGVPVLRSPLVTSELINAATLVMEELVAPSMKAQGTMVDILGMGVLIEGPPGIGKSEIALTLIEHGHSLVSDDVTRLQRLDRHRIVGSAAAITRYHMEIRGLGIVHVPGLFGVSSVRREKTLDLIVTLYPWDGSRKDLADPDAEEYPVRDVLGVRIPAVALPVAPGRDMAHVIEVAGLNQKLRSLGHDAAKELDERVMDMLVQKGKG